MLREQWRTAWEQVGRWRTTDEESHLAAQLLLLAQRGWRLLMDRGWPVGRARDAGVLLIGPGGVFVVGLAGGDGADLTGAGGSSGGDSATDGRVAALLAAVRGVERGVESLGLSPVAVQPVLAVAGERVGGSVGRVRLLGGRELAAALAAERRRVVQPMVRAIADHLLGVLPGYESVVVAAPAARPTDAPITGPDGLFDVTALRDAELAAALRAPVERWMTFLHPDQVALVRRNWSGPARISGPAGTGKTVVGLHRAAYLARRTTGRILYVTYANNLPRVQGTFLRAMAPATSDRVEFHSVHAWAQEFLHERGVPVRLNGDKAEDAFSRAWLSTGRATCLSEIDPAPRYWHEEIDHVIKGRGLTSFEKYATLNRRGRLATLRRSHREAVWALYQEYQRLLAEREIHDFNDVLALALAEAAREADRPRYAAVIADEVQDLTLVGVRLLHALVGDAANGLLLIGDGQQAVYPGGFRLGDAGVDVRGDRGQVLRVNYRNAREILEAALSVVADDAFDDLDGTRTLGTRDVELTYHDGRVIRVGTATLAEHDQALLDSLHRHADAVAGEPSAGGEPGSTAVWGDMAVLCPTRRGIAHYQRLLTRAGIPVCLLDHYDGHPVDAVKIGSYRRAKGLEFKHVWLPEHDSSLKSAGTAGRTGAGGTDDEVGRERAALARSQLFVAMTRARDTLWLGRVTDGVTDS
ncbi:UvrD-helicase domain-containing protein [Kitasatospora sp. NPDC052896]|uniref:UvrD-helicase domain-containing protein n=1 Tax=Kitasatospora sp. NPDC052896 TaxID=3364061 RepID=UPI0037C893BA